MTGILEKHRVAALFGVALLVVPVAASSLLGTQAAQAAAPQSFGSALADGSFAAIVSADKPAVVTITTTLKAENASADSSSPHADSPALSR